MTHLSINTEVRVLDQNLKRNGDLRQTNGYYLSRSLSVTRVTSLQRFVPAPSWGYLLNVHWFRFLLLPSEVKTPEKIRDLSTGYPRVGATSIEPYSAGCVKRVTHSCLECWWSSTFSQSYFTIRFHIKIFASNQIWPTYTDGKDKMEWWMKEDKMIRFVRSIIILLMKYGVFG